MLFQAIITTETLECHIGNTYVGVIGQEDPIGPQWHKILLVLFFLPIKTRLEDPIVEYVAYMGCKIQTQQVGRELKTSSLWSLNVLKGITEASGEEMTNSFTQLWAPQAIKPGKICPLVQ